MKNCKKIPDYSTDCNKICEACVCFHAFGYEKSEKKIEISSKYIY